MPDNEYDFRTSRITIEEGGPAQSRANSRWDTPAIGSGSTSGQHSQVDAASEQARCPSPSNRFESAPAIPGRALRPRAGPWPERYPSPVGAAGKSGGNVGVASLFMMIRGLLGYGKVLGDRMFRAI